MQVRPLDYLGKCRALLPPEIPESRAARMAEKPKLKRDEVSMTCTLTAPDDSMETMSCASCMAAPAQKPRDEHDGIVIMKAASPLEAKTSDSSHLSMAVQCQLMCSMEPGAPVKQAVRIFTPCMPALQLSQRKYEESRSRVAKQRARDAEQEEEGTALQRIADAVPEGPLSLLRRAMQVI